MRLKQRYGTARDNNEPPIPEKELEDLMFGRKKMEEFRKAKKKTNA